MARTQALAAGSGLAYATLSSSLARHRCWSYLLNVRKLFRPRPAGGVRPARTAVDLVSTLRDNSLRGPTPSGGCDWKETGS